MTADQSLTTNDRFGRKLGSVRLSVTDRCNLRCTYCMPEEDYDWLPRSDILSFGEIERLVRAFVACGASRFRLTGGEPLLRRDLPELAARISAVSGVDDLALTTNGILLPKSGAALRAAGVRRVTVSIDTLRPDRFTKLTGRGDLAQTRAGIEAARDLGFDSVKLNTVVVRGFNDDEIADLLGYAREVGAELRFIEYMDVGGATQWARDQVVSRDEVLATIGRTFGSVTEVPTHASAPASRFSLSDGTRFGVIASTTAPFCADCDRARITADGTLLTCLYAKIGVDIRRVLRSDASDEDVRAKLASIWNVRVDRGAEQRLELASERRALAAADELRGNPHLEMHTRGG